MKKALIISFLMICLQLNGFSQMTGHLHADLGLLQNHGGFFKLYNGIIEAGADYGFALTRDLFAGPAMHIGYLNRNNTGMNAVFYKPALALTYNFHIMQRVALVPVGTIGYTLARLRNDSFNYKETQSGMNAGFDLRLIWKTQERTDFYIFGRFNYLFLDEDPGFTELDYYRKMYQTAFGAGIRIK